MTAREDALDPRAIRATVGTVSRHDLDPTVVVAPGTPSEPGVAGNGGPSAYLVDGVATEIRSISLDRRHTTVASRASGAHSGDGADSVAAMTRVYFGDTRRRPADGMLVREVIVNGWRVEVELERETRAALRDRARRAGAATVAGGPAEVHAIIPGRIVAVSVVPGDAVTAGQQLLVLEAMKMQNELRAPREGVVEQVAVAVGDTVEVGDLLLVVR